MEVCGCWKFSLLRRRDFAAQTARFRIEKPAPTASVYKITNESVSSLRTSDLNTTRPAAAARAPAASTDYLLLAPGLRQATDVDRRDRQTDRQTDIRPLRRPSTMRAASAIITGALPAIKPETTAIRIIVRLPLENNPNVS